VPKKIQVLGRGSRKANLIFISTHEKRKIKMKTLMFTAIAITILFSGLTGVSMAGHHYHGCGGMKISNMTEMDSDNDGFISLEEFTQPFMGKYERWFEAIDTNDDDSLSQDEWDAFRRAHGYDEDSEG
jgi:hypothetical protein